MFTLKLCKSIGIKKKKRIKDPQKIYIIYTQNKMNAKGEKVNEVCFNSKKFLQMHFLFFFLKRAKNIVKLLKLKREI